MRIMITAALIAAAALAAMPHPGALAQSDAAEAVKERQELMRSFFRDYYGHFARLVRGETTDVAPLPEIAEKASAAVRRIPALFPPGSGREAVPETRATPAVWAERAEFEANVAKLAAETDRLAEVAKGGDVEAIRAQFANVSRACGACHGGPRASGGKFRFPAEQ